MPDTDSLDGLRQSIKEKLSEMGHELRTVQVCLQETMCGTRIGLQDTEGIFIDLVPGEPGRDQPMKEHEATGSKAEVDLEVLQIKTLKCCRRQSIK